LGPAAVQYLGDLGADVVKIEPPGGGWERTWAGGDTFPGGVSAFYLLAHRNVRSITLDLKNPRTREVTDRMIANADVLVENFRPGVMDKLGLGYDDVARANPRLIYASATGYGSDSPYRHLPGQDLLLQSLTGLAAITGRTDQVPSPAGAPVVDQHGAALLAMAILAALLHRERTGEGQRVEVNMVRAALDLQVEPATYYLNGGYLRRPEENLASAFHQAPYGIYPTADGHVAVSLSPISAVRAALDAAPELAPYEDPAIGLSSRDEIYRALAPLIAVYPTAEVVAKLRAGGVWCQAVNDYAAAFDDPIVRHVDPVIAVQHPDAGEFRTLRHPVDYSAGQPEIRNLGPAVGEHTDVVLAELGFSAAEIADLHTHGCVSQDGASDDS
jgi:crotonobetainyl-CoA:carnitine CoA-transferase CaiB-like acyl-CoA transferase